MPRDKYGKAVKKDAKPGIAHKPDGFKSEDQGGSGKTPNAGKVTEKDGAKPGKTAKEPSYSRRRH
ncbi:hypothetical protein [Paraburkholderia sp. HD33-4]|uniref:hypothetical protein n=1 Tax=Paraburkholderia sp. HD33-4 TaxID=2883242 RepID=UPI001F1C256F|nr:hypothetical protein [Paraburkholderia sp. HD33-4]